jgi:hypothetical protein
VGLSILRGGRFRNKSNDYELVVTKGIFQAELSEFVARVYFKQTSFEFSQTLAELTAQILEEICHLRLKQLFFQSIIMIKVDDFTYFLIIGKIKNYVDISFFMVQSSLFVYNEFIPKIFFSWITSFLRNLVTN